MKPDIMQIVGYAKVGKRGQRGPIIGLPSEWTKPNGIYKSVIENDEEVRLVLTVDSDDCLVVHPPNGGAK